MKKGLFTILSIFLFFSCENPQKPEALIDFVPNDAAVIIQTSNLQELQKALKSFSFFTQNTLSLEKRIEKDFSFLKYTDSITRSLISVSISKKGKLNYVIISNRKADFQLDSIQNKAVENIKYEGLAYKKLVLEENNFFMSAKNSPFIVATSEAQLRLVLKKENILNSEDFTTIYQAVAPNKTAVILNHTRLKDVQQELFPNLDLKKVNNFAGWSAVDLEFSNHGISFNGLSIPKDKKSLQQILRNTGPVSIDLAEIIPKNSTGFSAIGYQKPRIFLQNLKEFRGDSIQKPEDRIILNTQQAGIISTEENSLFALKTIMTTPASDLISGYAALEENYREFPIYKLVQPDVFQQLFNPMFDPENTDYVAAINQYLVFASSIPQLRELIADYVNQTTLAFQFYYKEGRQNLAAASSILMIGATENLKEKLAKAAANEYSTAIKDLNLTGYKLAFLQLVEESDFAHIHGSFERQNEGETSNNKTEEILSVTLDAHVLTEPILVKNHLNDQMDIAVQDINNTLYLISNKGTVFWKKELNGPILGKIQQVDLFKNGKTQIAFATPYAIEVIDRNGNTVKPFPLKFSDEITQPLSLFDYDNNRKYRFLITQQDEVFMYDKNGESVKGFDFQETNSEILQAPKHLRIQHKDYIVFPEKSGKLNILSRQGEHRVHVKEKIDFSMNEWYEFENDFVSTNAVGDLIKITQTGRVTKLPTNFGENHKITARPNLLVSLSENILRIRNKELNLDYGLYTEPQIFYVNDNYYISLTDLQTQKVYVFDSNAALLPGFPVYGTSVINLHNADIDNRPEFVVSGGEKEVLMYKL